MAPALHPPVLLTVPVLLDIVPLLMPFVQTTWGDFVSFQDLTTAGHLLQVLVTTPPLPQIVDWGHDGEGVGHGVWGAFE